MDITSIIIRKLTPENKMKAIVSITFEDAFVVHDVKVIDGANGLFIAMPSRRIQDGEFKDIVHPIHSAFREELSKAVLKKYYEALEHHREMSPVEGQRDRTSVIDRSENTRNELPSEDVSSGDERILRAEEPVSYAPSFTGRSVAAESNA
ncbi:MAG: septation regulator SpoVG [Clostridiales bacterium]|nr:septation regulator SpoVG [Clostridiales bacterium]